MTLGEYLNNATERLKKAEISSARLDVLILLEDGVGKDRAWILANQGTQLSKSQKSTLDKQITRRAAHEPIAYIRGFSEFYGRRFKVNKRVLEPRPESEAMIEILVKLKLPKIPKIADIGTGTGCLGITAALELDKAAVDLYDIDSGAVAVAKHNSHLHELDLQVYKRNLLNKVVSSYDVILANLPYVPSGWKLNKPAMAEPKVAIFGGKDGLDLYRRLFDQLANLKIKPTYVLTEALPPQHLGLAKIASDHGYKLTRSKDFIQLFKQA